MQADEFVRKVFTKFKGKPGDKAPKPNTPKFAMYLSIANDKVQDWVDDTEYVWRTVRRDEEIQISGDRFYLPEDYARLADNEIYVGDTKLKYLDFIDRRSGQDGIYEDGDALVLTKPENHAGKTLKISIIYYPDEVLETDDEFVCDNVNWLVLEVAAAIAFNDPQKQDNAADLQSMAEVAYSRMARRTRKGPRGHVRKVKKSMPRIGRTW